MNKNQIIKLVTTAALSLSLLSFSVVSANAAEPINNVPLPSVVVERTDLQETASLQLQIPSEISYLNSLKDKMQSLEDKVKVLDSDMLSISQSIDNISTSDLLQGDILDKFRQQISEQKNKADEIKTEMMIGSNDYSNNLKPNYSENIQNISIIESVLTSNNIATVLSKLDKIETVSKSDAQIIIDIINHRKLINEKVDDIKNNYDELDKILDQLEIEQTSLNHKKTTMNLTTEELVNSMNDDEIAENDKKYMKNGEVPSVSSYIGLTYPCPAFTQITCGFGEYSGHSGCDFSTNGLTNQKIVAAESGTVILAKNLEESYGHYIVIRHDKTTPTGQVVYTLYAHNNKLLVSEGEYVEKGQQIAYSGSTGNSTGPHCHFEIRIGGSALINSVDPSDWLK